MGEVPSSDQAFMVDRPAKHSRKLTVALVVVVVLTLGSIVGFRSVWGMYYIPSVSMAPTLVPNDRIAANKLAYRLSEPKHGDVVVLRAPRTAMPIAERLAQLPAFAGDREITFIERVIGLPGDRIRITAGYVRVGNCQYSHQELACCLTPASSTRDEQVWIKLTSKGVMANGRLVTGSQVASAVGDPDASVKIVPGVVYRNGKALDEPYVAEDPDVPYPMSSTPKRWIRTVDGQRVVVIPKGRLLVMGDNRNDSNDSRYWGLLERKRLIGKATAITYPTERAGPIR